MSKIEWMPQKPIDFITEDGVSWSMDKDGVYDCFGDEIMDYQSLQEILNKAKELGYVKED